MQNPSRRNANIAVGGILTGASLFITPSESNAYLQFLLRLILQGAFRSTVSRTVTTTATRTLANGAVRTAVTSFKTIGSLGMTATGIATVSGTVWAIAKNNNAKQIWVADQETVNRFQLVSDKATTETVRIFPGYRIVDASTGKIERTSVIEATAIAGSKPFEFTFEVKNLPNQGLKRIEPFVSYDEKGEKPHPGYRTSHPEIVYVTEPSEVTFA